MASEGSPIWFDTVDSPKLTRSPSDKTIAITDERRETLAQARKAYDEKIQGIRNRNGESYRDRTKQLGDAATQIASHQENLEESE